MSADAPDSPPQQPVTEIVPAYPTNLVPRQSAGQLATNQRRAAETRGIFYSPQSTGNIGVCLRSHGFMVETIPPAASSSPTQEMINRRQVTMAAHSHCVNSRRRCPCQLPKSSRSAANRPRALRTRSKAASSERLKRFTTSKAPE